MSFVILLVGNLSSITSKYEFIAALSLYTFTKFRKSRTRDGVCTDKFITAATFSNPALLNDTITNPAHDSPLHQR